METTTREQIATALFAYAKNNSLDNVEIAKKTKVDKAYIGSIMVGDFYYTANNTKRLIPAKHFNVLADFIGLQIEKSYWENQPTPQMIKAIGVLADAKKFGETNVIVGDTGCGKTHTINAFLKANPKDTFVVTVGSIDSIADLIDILLDKLHLPIAKTKGKKVRDIIKKLKNLKNEGEAPIIIFDEAEYMKQVVFNLIKQLYDGLKGYCGIVLIGTDQIMRKIEALKRRDKDGIPQFYRRIKFNIRTLPKVDKDISYKLFLTDITDNELIKLLKANCDNYGELHDVLVPSLREADRTNQPLTIAFVKMITGIN